MRGPAVVRTPAVQMMSFTPTGTPASTPTSWPARTCRSISAAAARASASLTVRNAPTCGSAAAMRSRAARTSSTDDTSRWRTRRAAPRTPRAGGGRLGVGNGGYSMFLGARDTGAPRAGAGAGARRRGGGGIRRRVGRKAGAEAPRGGGGRPGAGARGGEPLDRLGDVIETGREPPPPPRLGGGARERRAPPHLVARDRHE